MLGVLTMAQTESPLSLEAASGLEDGKSVVVARLRNRSKKPCVVVVDDYFCRIETELYDAAGKLLEPRDARAVLGRRMPPDRINVATLKPGESAEVMTFSIVTDYANAMAGPLSWEVQDLAGQTLKGRSPTSSRSPSSCSRWPSLRRRSMAARSASSCSAISSPSR